MRSAKFFLAVFFILGTLFLSAAPSPWDSWRSGYTNFEQGESFRERGNYTEALKFFEKARKNYLAVRTARPDWNQRVIADRLRDCDRQIAELRRLLGLTATKTKPENEKEIKKTSGRSEVPSGESTVQTPSVTDSERVAALRRQVIELKLSSQRLNAELQKQRKFETEIASLLRDRKVVDERYALLEKRYKALEEELKTPNERISSLEQQLVDERLNKERIAKQYSSAEQQLKIEKENSRLNQIAKKALEDLLKKRNEELQQKNHEISTLLERSNEVAKLNNQVAELNQIIKLRNDEIAELKKASDSGKNESIENKRQLALWQNERKLLEDKITVMTKERDGLAESLRDLQGKNDTLASENRKLHLDWEKEKNAVRLNAAELSNLRERNQKLEEDLKSVYKRAEDFEKRLSTRNSADFQAAAAAKNSMKQLENDLLAAQNQLISLRSELDAAKSGNDERERKLKAVNDENLKVRAEVVAALEKEKTLQQELVQLRPLKEQLEQLQRNFQALSAENRENRLLVEAAKPRQAELEKAKLRLVENDRLKNELAKEQQLNAELKSAYNKDQAELTQLRRRSAEFETSRRKMAELEAKAKEADRLQNVEKELISLRQREVELAALKIKLGEVENSLRKVNDDFAVSKDENKKLSDTLNDLRKKNSELERLQRVNKELDAMIASQSAELDKLNKQVAAFQAKQSVDVHVVCRTEIEKLRTAAASAVARASAVAEPLNERIGQLQNELDLLKEQKKVIAVRESELIRKSKLKDSEIAQLRRLNNELAEFRNKSANDLLAKVDASKVARLEDELTAINKLNAELAAERDKLLAQLENRKNDENGENVPALQSERSPEELAGAGLNAEKEGKLELAVWHYQQALANKKDFAPAHLRLGMIYYRRGSFAEAAPHLSAAYHADPGNHQLALVTARCFIAVSRFGNAKTIVDKLLKAEPENALVLMCAALIDAGCGAPARAEEKLLSAARLNPASFEIQLELAKLLASSISDRRREAVIAYEKARELGAAPEPEIEKQLGSMLDHRRELVRFMSGAAKEAEVSSDWRSAAWYYKKITEENHPGYIPLLAFAQWKSGNASAAKETLEFNKPSRNAMVVKFLIAYTEKDYEAAMRAAQQCIGAVIPADWVGVNLELEKLKKQSNPLPAVKVLLKSLQANKK